MKLFAWSYSERVPYGNDTMFKFVRAMSSRRTPLRSEVSQVVKRVDDTWDKLSRAEKKIRNMEKRIKQLERAEYKGTLEDYCRCNH